MTDADRYFAMDPKMGKGATGGAYVEVDKDVSAVEFVPGLVFRPGGRPGHGQLRSVRPQHGGPSILTKRSRLPS
jgi:hypothetical protein